VNGIGVEEAGADAPRIEIMFGGESPGDEPDEAPEIEDAGRVKTMLSFESFLKRKRMLPCGRGPTRRSAPSMDDAGLFLR